MTRASPEHEPPERMTPSHDHSCTAMPHAIIYVKQGRVNHCSPLPVLLFLLPPSTALHVRSLRSTARHVELECSLPSSPHAKSPYSSPLALTSSPPNQQFTKPSLHIFRRKTDDGQQRRRPRGRRRDADTLQAVNLPWSVMRKFTLGLD